MTYTQQRKMVMPILKMIVILLMISGCSYDPVQKDNEQDAEVYEQTDSLDIEEKIISQGVLVDRDQMEHSVILYEDQGIRLMIGESTILIKPEDSHQQQDQYTLHITDSMVAVMIRFDTTRGQGIDYHIYTYRDRDHHIQEVFSTADMTCRIQEMDLDRGEMWIDAAFADRVIRYVLTDDEREQTAVVISELIDNGIAIDDELMIETAHHISCQPIEMVIDDVDQDGTDEILLLTNIRTLGASTPLRMNANSVLLFEMKDDTIRYMRVEYDRDRLSEDDLFSYFPQPLVVEK